MTLAGFRWPGKGDVTMTLPMENPQLDAVKYGKAMQEMRSLAAELAELDLQIAHCGELLFGRRVRDPLPEVQMASMAVSERVDILHQIVMQMQGEMREILQQLQAVVGRIS